MPTRAKKRTLPSSLWSALGPIPVKVVEHLTKTDEALGLYDFAERTIKLDAGNSPEAQLQTLFHEAVHVALIDGGAHHSLTHEQREAVCDALGTWLAGACLAGRLTFK